MAALNTGEMVGLIAADAQENYTGKFETSAINCRINLDTDDIAEEEKHYHDMPKYYHFGDQKDTILRRNFDKINTEIENIVSRFRKPAQAPTPQVRPAGNSSGTTTMKKR